MTWALRDAPAVPSHAVAVLIGLANHANEEGRGAYPSQKLLGKYARKVERQVRKDLQTLEELKLIRRGDQRIVAHIPADRRPIVWDLAMELTSPQTGVTTVPAGTTGPVVQYPPEPDDRSSSTERGEPQFRQTIREPTTTACVGSSQVGARKRATTAPDRGTRIPDDFTLTDEMRNWGREKYPNVNGEEQTAAFIDYWKSVPGTKGRKVDWNATWRTWIRRAAEHTPRTNGHAPAGRRPADDLGSDAHMERYLARVAAREGATS
jgi:hypothetical protein